MTARFPTVRDVTRAPACSRNIGLANSCYVRDPDGYLIEVGRAKGRLAEQAPAGREAGRADGR